MTEEKKRVNAYIPIELYTRVTQECEYNITEAITKGLELLLDRTNTNHLGYYKRIECRACNEFESQDREFRRAT